MTVSEAKEEIFALIATLKLTEKEILSLEEEAAKWRNRTSLALSRGENDLVAEARKEEEKIITRLQMLKEEKRSFKNDIDDLRFQLPALAAQERSIDPVLLEQELSILIGKSEEELKTERAFKKLEKENAADSALEDLKTKMKE